MKTSNATSNPDEKKYTLFDMLNIMESIKTPWNELSEEQQKLWSPYMINRFISSREEYLPFLDMISQFNLTNEQHYTFLCNLIDGSRKHYFDYKAYKGSKDITEEDKLLIWACCREYEIGAKEAKSYLKMMSNTVKSELKSKWEDAYKALAK